MKIQKATSIPIVVATMLLLLAPALFAQDIPAEVLPRTLYEGELNGVMTHTAQINEVGTWAFYLGTGDSTELAVVLPNGGRLEHQFEDSFGNFFFFELDRPGELTIEFAPAPESFGGFYAFVLAPAVDLEIDAWNAVELQPAPVDGSPETILGVGIYRIVPPEDGLVELEIPEERYEFNLRIGGPDSVSLQYDPWGGSVESSGINMRFAAERDGEYGVIVILDNEERDPASEIAISVSTSELVLDTPEPIFFGESVVGEVTPGSATVEGRLARPYYYDGIEGEEIAVILESIDFDAYLIIRTPSGEIVTDDDGAYERNSLAILTLPESGPYEIFASSFSGSSTGAFSIQVGSPQEIEGYIADVAGDWGWDEFEDPPDTFAGEDRVTDVTTLIPGAGAGVTLNEDGSIYRGAYVAVFDLVIDEVTSVQIDLTSNEIDTYLTVEDPSGVELSDDDGGDGTDSRLLIPNAFPGVYRIYAGSYGGNSTGPVSVDVFEYVSGPRALDAPAIGLALDRPLSGEIDASSPVYNGQLAEVYEFELSSRMSIAVAMISDDFDTYLYVEGPAGTTTSDDDGGEFTNSRWVLENANPGVYRIYATSFGGKAQGRFELTVEEEL